MNRLTKPSMPVVSIATKPHPFPHCGGDGREPVQERRRNLAKNVMAFVLVSLFWLIVHAAASAITG